MTNDGKWGKDGDLDMEMMVYSNFHCENELDEVGHPMRPLRSRPAMDQYGERIRYRDHDADRFTIVENLENSRAELLRKLDELKDQLTRSCDLGEKPNGLGTDRWMPTTPPNPYGRHHAAYVQEGLASSHGVNQQPLGPSDLKTIYSSYDRGRIPHIDNFGLKTSPIFNTIRILFCNVPKVIYLKGPILVKCTLDSTGGSSTWRAPGLSKMPVKVRRLEETLCSTVPQYSFSKSMGATREPVTLACAQMLEAILSF
ncbi:Hypothetical predicted protein [Olea europaea subsp. europaea]|uniref:Uncharacterized protein n=1 Tax=Olea europaea subsp. europaea TaxID=158383 RepID=A0A8S0SUP0_OLEEU|nr:Hypothetical predicted protein [Olea europaea subsp. europaea]